MKKFVAALISLLIIAGATFLFLFDRKSDLTKIKVAEVTHSVFYAPQYVALDAFALLAETILPFAAKIPYPDSEAIALSAQIEEL